MFFSTEDNQFDASKKCPKCSDGKIGLQLGKYGAFIGCNNYPECKYTKQIANKKDVTLNLTMKLILIKV